MKSLLVVLISILFGLSSNLFSQKAEQILSFSQKRTEINKNAMIVLGSWAVANIAVGTYGNFKSQGEAKYFHQFNAIWNSVNLGIAAWSYLNPAINSNPTEILREYNSLQNFLMLNAGLDAAYIATGFFLREKSINKNSKKLNGYGNSLILQGAFLLAFDLTLFLINQNHAETNFYPYLNKMISGNTSIGFLIKI